MRRVEAAGAGRRPGAAGVLGSSLCRPGGTRNPARLRVLGSALPAHRGAGRRLRGAGTARSWKQPPLVRVRRPLAESPSPWAPARPAAAFSSSGPAAPAAVAGGGAALSAPGTERGRERGRRPAAGRRRGGGASAAPSLSLRADPASSLSPRGPCPPEPGVPLRWL